EDGIRAFHVTGVQTCALPILSTINVVPTNTEHDWYKNLSKLSNRLCKIELYQSKREEWIRVQLTYDCMILTNKEEWQGYISYKILNLLSPAILKLNTLNELTNLCTYMAERVPYASMDTNTLKPNFTKNISLVFSKHVMEEHYQVIHDQLCKLLSLIEEESDLIQEDNLARGSVIETVRAVARLSKNEKRTWWDVRTNGLVCSFGEKDPPEYWGDIGLYNSDFISGSTKYPWMPSDISKDEFPF